VSAGAILALFSCPRSLSLSLSHDYECVTTDSGPKELVDQSDERAANSVLRENGISRFNWWLRYRYDSLHQFQQVSLVASVGAIPQPTFRKSLRVCGMYKVELAGVTTQRDPRPQWGRASRRRSY